MPESYADYVERKKEDNTKSTYSTRLNWFNMCLAPTDKFIVVKTNSYEELQSFETVVKYNNSAGFCVDELRTPVMWRHLTDIEKHLLTETIRCS